MSSIVSEHDSEIANDEGDIAPILKDKQYRQRWISEINEKFTADTHPYLAGVHMETHHLITSKAANSCFVAKILSREGYDINLLPNLAGFPATLPGACHLGIQLHRGSHPDRNIDPKAYHKVVERMINENAAEFDVCNKNYSDSARKANVHKEADEISAQVLKKILNFELRLTYIHDYFKNGGDGCCNVHNIGPARKASRLACKKTGRNHIGETITNRNETKTINWSGGWTPKIGA
ncbi:AHH domain-containing protein [Photobacterium nomapromontoriensis]|uniref:AHH domain-containing protein n=1 Tax=Photobacterium nomapromontoriensis TaxID=2910237 RepID=UPI003D10CDEF